MSASRTPASPPRIARPEWWRWLASAAGGALLAVAAGWPGHVGVDDGPALGAAVGRGVAAYAQPWVERWAWALQAGGLALWLWALVAGARMPKLRTAVALTAVFAGVWQGATLSWLHIGLHKYLGLPFWAAGLAVAALVAYLAAFTVLAALGWAWALRHGRPRTVSGCAVAALGFGGWWMLAEWGRIALFTGFPWAAAGHAHVHGPGRVLLPWLGAHGVGALAVVGVAMAVLLATAPSRTGSGTQAARTASTGWTPHRLAGLLLAGLTVGLWALPDARFTDSAGEFDALLLQGNVAQDRKFEAGDDGNAAGQALGWHLARLAEAQVDLTLTPETAIPVLEGELPDGIRQRLWARQQAAAGVTLVGLPHGRSDGPQFNAFIGIGPATALLSAGEDGVYRYSKAHLVPFGEFTPPGFGWFTQRLELPMPHFTEPPDLAQPLVLRTRSGRVQRVAPLVCFEDLFGFELARRFADANAAPTVMANGSNLGYFDDSPAMAQHLRLARLRALEFQRPMLRAANTGATVLIDHRGDVVRGLRPFERGTLSVVAEGRQGLTPFARWGAAAGLWPLVAAAAVAVVLLQVLTGRAVVARLGADSRL